VKRRLAAALACRVQGSRLYGKPLQNLTAGVTILDHILSAARAGGEIDEIVLGISEGVENLPFAELAHRQRVSYIVGDQVDVLWRLIQCGRAAAATDVFRITTECPFTCWELLADVWKRHVDEGNDITVVDHVPEGVHFELYTLEALERAHREGSKEDRSEYCSQYPRLHQDRFKIAIVPPPAVFRRLDLRLTVDYPEDLVLCRRVYEALSAKGPRIPIADIVGFLDAHPETTALVAPYVDPSPLWDIVPKRG
jgi:spore coat polysaccharide biosynthesis protein SpsF